MNSSFDPASLLSQAGAGRATSAEQIREQLENNRVGCGCLGAVAVFLVATWFAVGAIFHMQVASMVAITLAAIVACAAITVRGHHFWTGLALLSLSITALGVFPVALSFIDRTGASLTPLPAWLQPTQAGPMILAGVGILSLGGILVQMRRSISTPESVYAIQLHAASKQTAIPTLQPQLETAFSVLKSHAQLGFFPIHAEYLTFGDRQTPPKRYTGQSFMGLLAVRCQPSNDPPTSTFDKTPWVQLPSPLTASMPNLGPQSVGILVADADSMRFLPIRTTVEELHIPWTALTRYTLRVNALELEYTLEGQEPKTIAFLCTHAWRFLSLCAFLRVFDATIDDENSALWARNVRDEMHSKATQSLTDQPKLSRLQTRIESLKTRLHPSLHPNLDAALEQLQSPYPTWRALYAPMLQTIDHITPKDPNQHTQPGPFFQPNPDDLDTRLQLLEDQLRLIPSEVWPDALSELAEDLQALELLHEEAWPSLISSVDQWAPREIAWAFEDDAHTQDETANDEPEDSEDSESTALVLANQHDDDSQDPDDSDPGTQRIEESHDAFIELIELVRDLSKTNSKRTLTPDTLQNLHDEASKAYPASLVLFELYNRARAHTS